MPPNTLEALVLSGAIGLAIGTFLYIRKPSMVRKTPKPLPNPADQVAARLRAVVPDELIEAIEVDLENPRSPIALELAREPTAEEQQKINRACSRAVADLLSDG